MKLKSQLIPASFENIWAKFCPCPWTPGLQLTQTLGQLNRKIPKTHELRFVECFFVRILPSSIEYSDAFKHSIDITSNYSLLPARKPGDTSLEFKKMLRLIT